MTLTDDGSLTFKCPYCGREVDQLPAHLPCDGNEDTEADAGGEHR